MAFKSGFNFWDFERRNVLSGIYSGYIRSIGAFQKPMFCFDVEGKRFHVWGSAILNHLMYGVPFGTIVTIKYLGKFMSDQSRHPMLQYDVHYELSLAQKTKQEKFKKVGKERKK